MKAANRVPDSKTKGIGKRKLRNYKPRMNTDMNQNCPLERAVNAFQLKLKIILNEAIVLDCVKIRKGLLGLNYCRKKRKPTIIFPCKGNIL